MMTPKETNFWLQLKAMVVRNFLIKARRKKKTISELVMPLCMLGVLVILRAIIPNPTFPRVDEPKKSTNMFKILDEFTSKKNFTLAVAPDSAHTKRFLDEINKTWKTFSNKTTSLEFNLFDTENRLIEAYRSNSTQFKFGVVFDNMNPFDGKISYSLLVNPSLCKIPGTKELINPEPGCREMDFAFNLDDGNHNSSDDGLTSLEMQQECPADAYYKTGFAALQMLIDFTKIQISCPGENVHIPNIILYSLPKDAYTADWLTGFRVVIPLYVVMALSQFINFLLTLIVGEKEKKIKATMKIVGLNDSVYWLSWFIIYVGFMFISSLLNTSVLCYLKVFRNSSSLLIFLLVFLYSVSIIIAAFMMTSFFEKAKTAGILGSFMLSVLSSLYFIQVYFSKTHRALLWFISLISPAAFALGMDKALVIDITENGLTLETMWHGSGFTVVDSLFMLVVDIVLYSLITLYLDAVWPSKYGTKKHPLFCMPFFKPSSDDKLSDLIGMESTPQARLKDVEEVPEDQGRREAIILQSLHKSFSYSRRTVTALAGIDLVIYEGEITAVLGKNGAGKSTLVNILTGMTSPTHGTAYVYGRDIRNAAKMTEVQKMIGVCSQTDVLFERLTAREHLHFYARIKGVQSDSLELTVQSTLDRVGLGNDGEKWAKALSGGQKRKLSIGIALTGDPKIIILDEPTSGVDAITRRNIWSLLINMKQEKVILLITHSMEEADIVADRKAIICNGKIRCCGSSLFLKNRFGVGSRLMIQLKNVTCSEAVCRIVKSYVPTAKLSSVFRTELQFILPNQSIDLFAPLLFLIEKEIKSPENKFYISSYSLNMSSLEQVFIQITDEADFLEIEGEENSATESVVESSKNMREIDIDDTSTRTDDPKDTWAFTDIEYKPSVIAKFRSVLRLRLMRLFRDPRHIILIIILPLICQSFGFWMNTKLRTKEEQKSTNFFSLEMYQNNSAIAVYSGLGNDTAPLLTQLSSLVSVHEWNGRYASLLNSKPLMGALHLDKCCHPDNLSLMILYNDTMQHSLPVLVNLIDNILLRTLLPKESNISSIQISTQTRKLPMMNKVKQLDMVAFVSGILIGMSFAMIVNTLVSDINYDRKCKMKHLLHVHGVPRSVYYLVSLLVAWSVLLLAGIALLVLVSALGLVPVHGLEPFLVLCLVLLCYCPPAILCLTAISHFFVNPHEVLSTITSWMGTLAYIITVVLDSFGKGIFAHRLMSFCNVIYPPYAMLLYVDRAEAQCDAVPDCTRPLYFSEEIVTLLLGSIAQTPFWTCVLFWLDLRSTDKSLTQLFWRRSIPTAKPVDADTDVIEDEDVAIERERVSTILHGGREDSYVAVVQDLSKRYEQKNCCKKTGPESKLAVHNLSFGVPKEEVFGLLGHNGAGKTTIMKIMTGEVQPTSGRVWVKGMSPLLGTEGLIGYCPQHDALWTYITVQEHLEIYATIRGVQPQHLSGLVSTFISGLGLSDHAGKMVQHCSGGTQRKLSFALCLLGYTCVVLLDEPSTGLDARSRHFLWSTIRHTFQKHRGAILTTHSMEEADALCSRVGIMTKGHLRCIGTTQHLKNIYGGDYILEMKLFPSASNTEVKQFVECKFANSKVIEEVMARLRFSIPQAAVPSMAEVFFSMEQVKSELKIALYSFSQTSLEQVFLNLSSEENKSSHDNSIILDT